MVIIALDAYFWVCLLWMGGFIPWFLFPLRIFRKCMLPAFLTCPADVFADNACRGPRQGYWVKLGDSELEKTVFLICSGWDQREKGDLSRFPAAEIGTKLGGRDLKSSRKSMGLLPSAHLLSKRSDL